MSALLHTESALSYFSATNGERAKWGPKRCAKFRAQVFDRAYFVRLCVIWKPDGDDTVSVLQVCKSRESIEAAFSLTGWLQGFHFEAKMDACAHFFLMPPCPRLDSYITPMSGGMQAPAKARAHSECDHRFYAFWYEDAGSSFFFLPLQAKPHVAPDLICTSVKILLLVTV